jgi:hypothetical protein
MAAITIDQLRVDWFQQVAEFDRIVDLLEEEKKAGVVIDGVGPPHRAWTELLRDWRAELVQPLKEYPGNHDA